MQNDHPREPTFISSYYFFIIHTFQISNYYRVGPGSQTQIREGATFGGKKSLMATFEVRRAARAKM